MRIPEVAQAEYGAFTGVIDGTPAIKSDLSFLASTTASFLRESQRWAKKQMEQSEHLIPHHLGHANYIDTVASKVSFRYDAREASDTMGQSWGCRMNTLLKEISEWKLAAQREDNSRYFFHTAELEEIRKGKKLYVIGRKGTGKTAISENFRLLAAYNIFSEMLSFKSFPFNELYDKRDDKFKRPSQFITIWKFITYVCICKMMSRNGNIDIRARDALQKLFPTDPVKRLGDYPLDTSY